jgi:hypothetical protein
MRLLGGKTTPAWEVLAALTFIIAGHLIYFKIAPH